MSRPQRAPRCARRAGERTGGTRTDRRAASCPATLPPARSRSGGPSRAPSPSSSRDSARRPRRRPSYRLLGKAVQPTRPSRSPPTSRTVPETLEPAPTAVVPDTPKWTELPKPVADVFGSSLDKGKFQAFAAMTQSTVCVRLKAAPEGAGRVPRARRRRRLRPAELLDPASTSTRPASDGKDRFGGYEWAPLAGTLVKKGSADADQSWDAAITAVTQGSTTGVDRGLDEAARHRRGTSAAGPAVEPSRARDTARAPPGNPRRPFRPRTGEPMLRAPCPSSRSPPSPSSRARRPARADLYFVTASEGELEAHVDSAARCRGRRVLGALRPHEVYSLHLSSLYVWLDDDDYVEAGWAWYAGDGPEAYVAYEREGHTTEQERIWLGPCSRASWIQIEIVNVSGDTSGPCCGSAASATRPPPSTRTSPRDAAREQRASDVPRQRLRPVPRSARVRRRRPLGPMAAAPHPERRPGLRGFPRAAGRLRGAVSRTRPVALLLESLKAREPKEADAGNPRTDIRAGQGVQPLGRPRRGSRRRTSSRSQAHEGQVRRTGRAVRAPSARGLPHPGRAAPGHRHPGGGAAARRRRGQPRPA